MFFELHPWPTWSMYGWHLVPWLICMVFGHAAPVKYNPHDHAHGSRNISQSKNSPPDSSPEILNASNHANVWSKWSRWTECSVTCSTGIRGRTRQCESGTDCPGDSQEQQVCTDAECMLDNEGRTLVYSYCKQKNNIRHASQKCIRKNSNRYRRLCQNSFAAKEKKCATFKTSLKVFLEPKKLESVLNGQDGTLDGISEKYKKKIIKDICEHYRRPPNQKTGKSEFKECCGYILIDTRESLCCDGIIQWRAGLDMACCGKVSYNLTIQNCQRNIIIEKNNTLNDVLLQPKHVRVSAVSSSVIGVVWDPPVVSRPKSRASKTYARTKTTVHGYCVYCDELDANDDPVPETMQQKVTNKHKFLIAGLKADTRYRIYVEGYKWEDDGVRRTEPKIVRTKRAATATHTAHTDGVAKDEDHSNDLTLIAVWVCVLVLVPVIVVLMLVVVKKRQNRQTKYRSRTGGSSISTLISSSKSRLTNDRVEVLRRDVQPVSTYHGHVNFTDKTSLKGYSFKTQDKLITLEEIQPNNLVQRQSLGDLDEIPEPGQGSANSKVQVNRLNLNQDWSKNVNTSESNLTSSLYKDSTTQTFPPKKSNACDSFGRPFQFSFVVPKSQPSITLEHSDVKMTLSEKDLKAGDIKCFASTHSNIAAICQKLDLSTDERIVSPAIEYSLPDVTKLQDYAVIEMPFLGNVKSLKVWRSISDEGKNKLADKREIPRREEMDRDLDTFYIQNERVVYIYTKVFSWYTCTNCETRRKINLQAFIHTEIISKNFAMGQVKSRVHLKLYIVDDPVYTLKDYSWGTFKADNIKLEWINLPPEITEDDNLEAFVNLKDPWLHVMDPDDADYEVNRKNIPISHVAQCHHCSANTGPYSCSWDLENKDGSNPCVFKGFLYVGCSVNMNQKTRFVVEEILVKEDAKTIAKILGSLNPAETNLLREKLIGLLGPQITSNKIEEILSQLQALFPGDPFAERIFTCFNTLGLDNHITVLNTLGIIPDHILKHFKSLQSKSLIEIEHSDIPNEPPCSAEKDFSKGLPRQTNSSSQSINKIGLPSKAKNDSDGESRQTYGSLLAINQNAKGDFDKVTRQYLSESNLFGKNNEGFIRGELPESPPSSFKQRAEECPDKIDIKRQDLTIIPGELNTLPVSSYDKRRGETDSKWAQQEIVGIGPEITISDDRSPMEKVEQNGTSQSSIALLRSSHRISYPPSFLTTSGISDSVTSSGQSVPATINRPQNLDRIQNSQQNNGRSLQNKGKSRSQSVNDARSNQDDSVMYYNS